MSEPTEEASAWMSQLSPATLELAYELLERQQRRHEFLGSLHRRRVVLATPDNAVRLETNYLLLPQSVGLRDHNAFAPYVTHALRLTAMRARLIVAEEEEASGNGLGEAAPFFPTAPEENSPLDPGAFPAEMAENTANPEFAEEFRAYVRAGFSAAPPARPVRRPTLSLNFDTPRGEIGVTVDRVGLPTHIFSRLQKQHSESILWMAHEGARRMLQRLRDETQELRKSTYELADVAAGAPKFADLDPQPELAGPNFTDEYEQERHGRFVASLRELQEESEA
ncbi:hypothetical protein [Segniliparus rotundus]|uniref:hypothetical protein n=1 Tax=Segniliparus rotundus TaxID=286802 RepID=UPI001FE05C8D|nr:hypothetical protein [Segniliparus rotundus]